NTMVLITSSVTMVMAWARLKVDDLAAARLFLIATFLLAGTFLVVKYFEYNAKFHHYRVELKEPMVVNGEPTTVVEGHLGPSESKFTIGLKPTSDDVVYIKPDPPRGQHAEA